MATVKMPVLLDGQTVNVKSSLRPSTLSVTLNAEPFSTAQMTLQKDQPELTVGDWVRLWTTQGDAGVFVVKVVQTNYITGERSVQLEHAFGLLQNYIVFGEMTSTDLGGNSNGVTVKNAVTALLKKQQGKNYWKLGTCAFTDNKPWKFSNNTVYQCLTTLLSALDGWKLTFSMNSVPFTVNIEKYSSSPECEMRVSRNVNAINVSIDKTDMFTRIYPIGSNNCHIDGNYLSKNEDTWGIICHVETCSDYKDKALLKSWAQAKLNTYCEPLITVSVNGRELSDLTGADWDTLTPGKMCRVPLPDYGTSVKSRINKIEFRDLINSPDSVQVTLCNIRKDLTTVIKELKSGGGSAKDRNAENNEVLETFVNATDNLITLWAKKTINDVVQELGSIKVQSDKIQLAVTKAKKTDAGAWLTELASSITLQSDKIALVVSESDGKNVINAASIVMGINHQDKESSSYVDISADYINLTGYVTVSDFNATNAKITNLMSGTAVATLLACKSLSCSGTGSFTTMNLGGSSVSRKTVTITSTSLPLTLQYVGW